MNYDEWKMTEPIMVTDAESADVDEVEGFCDRCRHVLFPRNGHMDCPRCSHLIEFHRSDFASDCGEWEDGLQCAEEKRERAADAAFDSYDERSDAAE